MQTQIFNSQSEANTHEIGKQIAKQLTFPSCVYLSGDLGAGKTTLTQSIIHGFGYQGAVTSPTYNLIQEYTVNGGIIYHMDLYRLDDAAELEFLGLADLWSDNSIFLIEWPNKGEGYLPMASHHISLIKDSDSDSVSCRQITFATLM